jgi:hypothetical protein
MPSATSSGEIQMTLHQVNQDGAGYVHDQTYRAYISNLLELF